MIVIEVKQVQTKQRSFPNKETGEVRTITEQLAYIHNYYTRGFRSEEPRSTIIGIEEGQAPYAPGLYCISDESFYFGDYDRLTLGRIRLAPIDLAAMQADLKQVAALVEAKRKLMAAAFESAAKAA